MHHPNSLKYFLYFLFLISWQTVNKSMQVINRKVCEKFYINHMGLARMTVCVQSQNLWAFECYCNYYYFLYIKKREIFSRFWKNSNFCENLFFIDKAWDKFSLCPPLAGPKVVFHPHKLLSSSFVIIFLFFRGVY